MLQYKEGISLHEYSMMRGLVGWQSVIDEHFFTQGKTRDANERAFLYVLLLDSDLFKRGDKISQLYIR